MNDDLENMLFNYESTYRTDFRIRQVQVPRCAERQETASAQSCNASPTRDVLKDIHTLSDWKRDCVPFDLFIKVNEIVRGNPTRIQEAYTEPKDVGREQARKTRPRLIMTPAVAIDDVEPKEARQLLVSDMYLPQSEIARREGAGPGVRAKTPRAPRLPAPVDPISLPPLRPAYVSPQWRLRSAAWDRPQRRAPVDAHREFFRRRSQAA